MTGQAPGWRAAILVASVLVVYLPALGGGYLWDDDVYVTDNLALRSVAGLVDIWRIPPTTKQYYPLTFTSFWLEYRLWGEAPFGYHATNVALHAANAVLVWRLLLLLGVPGAFAAAWIFAVHPLHVESVAWIAERKNVLSGFFALLATLSWVRFLGDGCRRRLAATGLCFGLALLAKTQVCGLPAVLFLLAWWKRPERLRVAVAPLAVLAAAGAGIAAITIWCERHVGEILYDPPRLDAVARLLVAGRAVWFYQAKLLWPADLRAIYGVWDVDPRAVGQVVLPLAAAAAMALLWGLRRHLGKGPVTAAASFLLCLAPTLGFVDFQFMRQSFVADHFAYLASIPAIALAVAAACRAAELLPAAGRLPAVRVAALVLLVGLLGVAGWRRAFVHRDEESLWRDNVERDPDCAAAHNHLGVAQLARGGVGEAIASFRTAATLDPTLADARHNWGMALQRQGRFDEAIAQYEAGLRLRPDSRSLRNSIGVAMHAKGDLDAAASFYEEAIRLDPAYATAHNNRGTILVARGDPAAAVEHFRTALRLQPAYPEAHDNWGVALVALGRREEALAHFEAAAAIDPGLAAAQRHWASTLAELGRYEDAVERYRAAIALQPSRPATHRELGLALLALGRVDDGVAALERAVDLGDPAAAEPLARAREERRSSRP